MFTAVPHDYDDLVSGRRLAPGNVDRDIVYLVMRQTIGWQREKAKISRRQFARFSGVSDVKHVGDRIDDLVERGIIGREAPKRCSAPYFWCKFENWTTAPAYEPKNPGDPPADPDDDEDDDPDDDSSTNPDQEEEDSGPPPAKIDLAPGRPRCFHLPQDHKYERIRYAVVGSYPVQVSTRTDAAGMLSLTIRGKAKETRTARELHPSSFAATAPAAEVSTTGLHSPSFGNTTEQNQRFTAIETVISALCEKFMERAVHSADARDRELIEACAAKLHASVPIDTLEQYAARELIAMQRRGKTLHPRILIALTEQANQDHWKRSRRHAARNGRETVQDAVRRVEDIAPAMTTPTAPPKALPCPACHGTGKGKGEWITRGGEFKEITPNCSACHGTGRQEATAAA